MNLYIATDRFWDLQLKKCIHSPVIRIEPTKKYISFPFSRYFKGEQVHCSSFSSVFHFTPICRGTSMFLLKNTKCTVMNLELIYAQRFGMLCYHQNDCAHLCDDGMWCRNVKNISLSSSSHASGIYEQHCWHHCQRKKNLRGGVEGRKSTTGSSKSTKACSTLRALSLKFGNLPKEY